MDSPLHLHYPAHVVQAADDRRMQTLPFDQVRHRIVACNRQPVILTVERIDQVEENLGLKICGLQLVDVIPEEMVGIGFGYGRNHRDNNLSSNSDLTKKLRLDRTEIPKGNTACTPIFLCFGRNPGECL
jgi:hypothetical protein